MWSEFLVPVTCNPAPPFAFLLGAQEEVGFDVCLFDSTGNLVTNTMAAVRDTTLCLDYDLSNVIGGQYTLESAKFGSLFHWELPVSAGLFKIYFEAESIGFQDLLTYRK